MNIYYSSFLLLVAVFSLLSVKIFVTATCIFYSLYFVIKSDRLNIYIDKVLCDIMSCFTGHIVSHQFSVCVSSRRYSEMECVYKWLQMSGCIKNRLLLLFPPLLWFSSTNHLRALFLSSTLSRNRKHSTKKAKQSSDNVTSSRSKRGDSFMSDTVKNWNRFCTHRANTLYDNSVHILKQLIILFLLNCLEKWLDMLQSYYHWINNTDY